MIIQRIVEKYGDCCGYTIETDESTITIEGVNNQGVDEHFGFTSNFDNAADLRHANIVGISYSTEPIFDLEIKDLLLDTLPTGWITNLLYVNIVTDSGIFQVTFFNQQDGHSDHIVKVSVGNVTLFRMTV